MISSKEKRKIRVKPEAYWYHTPAAFRDQLEAEIRKRLVECITARNLPQDAKEELDKLVDKVITELPSMLVDKLVHYYNDSGKPIVQLRVPVLVKIKGEFIGTIKPAGTSDWQFWPKGSGKTNSGSQVFPTIDACKASINEWQQSKNN